MQRERERERERKSTQGEDRVRLRTTRTERQTNKQRRDESFERWLTFGRCEAFYTLKNLAWSTLDRSGPGPVAKQLSP